MRQSIIRSKAPLRIGIAGGGTDVSPYCDEHGGFVLNAAINLFTYCTINPKTDGNIKFIAEDRNEHYACHSVQQIPLEEGLLLHKGVYNRLVKDYDLSGLSFEMTTYSDAPAGSGLGTSSTLVVCMIQAYVEWLNLPLGDYDIAQLAYQIERKDLNLRGGKQDQYAATFGGFNFMEFYSGDKVIVNPLRIKTNTLLELEASMILFFTGVSRSSDLIIKHQMKSLEKSEKLQAMHNVKRYAKLSKEAILKGDINQFFTLFKEAWIHKKNTSKHISSPEIEAVFESALSSGAICGKVSGAGGGGFILFYVNPNDKLRVVKALQRFNGKVVSCQFYSKGVTSWKI